VGQRVLASALGIPVKVSGTAGEGGPWGMALLALYMLEKGHRSLEPFLSDVIFAGAESTVEEPAREMARGFEAYIERYRRGLGLQGLAADLFDPPGGR
jgi:sugar (pentulose or hexulose) kinase